MSGNKIRVVVADDHDIIIHGLQYILNKQDHIEVVATALTGLSAVQKATELVPDVVVLDLKMPGLDGISAAEKIHAAHPTVHVIALSADITSMMFHRGLKAGITGFVDKQSGFDEIVRAINEVAAGNSYYCTRVRSLMAANLKAMLNAPSRTNRQLGSEDRELIAMLTDGKTVGQIAMLVKKSPKTIDARRRKVMQQLGLSCLSELTKYAIAEGITSPYLSYS